LILAALGLALILIVLGDAFVTIVLPKTVSKSVRPTQLFFDSWSGISTAIASRLKAQSREAFLGYVWPLSTIVLIALWAITLIFGFALIQFGLDTPLSSVERGFGTDLYMSAATFLTLGYGDVTATTALGRTVSMAEAGMGFGFLALVIGYLPVYYQAFSARERTALLLDARAGAPPMSGELLRFQGNDLTGLRDLFAEFERWSASLLEGFLSYPVLAYYRSQHAQLSWLACLTCVTDACAFVLAAYPEGTDEERALKKQAAVTFAISRHLAVDLAYVLGVEPLKCDTPRIDRAEFELLCREVESRGIALAPCTVSCDKLADYAAQYEPYFKGLANHLMLEIPAWMPTDERLASWQTSAWAGTTGHF
jgi:hypothetical protein